jgi:uncharacterized protein DUF3788
MKALLGDAYAGFQALVSRGSAEWRPSKNSPWLLKVSQAKRSLFYARPESGFVRMTVLLGQRAVDAALAGHVSKRLHESIRNAKAYPEGRPVTVVIRRASDLAKVEELLAVKLETTTRRGRAVETRAGRAKG